MKMHGGGPKVVAGLPLPQEYKKENLGLLEKGMVNLIHNINIVKQSGIKPVVCINCFHTDTKAEIAMMRKAAEKAGARCAVSTHWADGGDGAQELADAVVEAAEEKPKFKFLYPLEMKLRQRVETIAKNVYGADGVAWTPDAEAKAKMLENDPKFDDFTTMMVKTHLSLTHDPAVKGVPKNWTLPVRDVLIFSGAKFLCPCCGTISLMPGTSSDPAYRRVDVDVKTGKVTGLF
jgi:formate--tetrahydrofolate ligase